MLKENMILLSENNEIIIIKKVMKNNYLGIGINENNEEIALSYFEIERNHYKILNKNKSK